MKIISAITSPHEDDIIEKILRHRGQWDPPWKRVRKARGPPPTPQPSDPEEVASQAANAQEEFFPGASRRQLGHLKKSWKAQPTKELLGGELPPILSRFA